MHGAIMLRLFLCFTSVVPLRKFRRGGNGSRESVAICLLGITLGNLRTILLVVGRPLVFFHFPVSRPVLYPLLQFPKFPSTCFSVHEFRFPNRSRGELNALLKNVVVVVDFSRPGRTIRAGLSCARNGRREFSRVQLREQFSKID